MKIPREAWWIAGLTVVMAVIVGLLGVGQQARPEQARFVRTTYTTSEFRPARVIPDAGRTRLSGAPLSTAVQRLAPGQGDDGGG